MKGVSTVNGVVEFVYIGDVRRGEVVLAVLQRVVERLFQEGEESLGCQG